MKVELHLHTSRYSGCAINSPEEMMRGLIDAGYDAAYITEHDAVWSTDEIAELQRLFPQIRVFPGVELSLDAQHLLVLGTTDPKYLSLEEVEDVLRTARRDGHLTVLAHPFRWSGGSLMLEKGLLPDALEWFTNNQRGLAADTASDTAAEFHLAPVNGGDVHALEMIGHYWIETHQPVVQADDIRRIVLAGEYDNRPAR